MRMRIKREKGIEGFMGSWSRREREEGILVIFRESTTTVRESIGGFG